MDIAALAAFAPVKKALDIYRYLMTGTERQWKQAGTVVGSWIVGIALVFLVGASSFDFGLGIDNWADYVLYGITLGSLAGVAADFTQPEGVIVR